MKKRIIIVLSAIVVIVVGAMLYMNWKNRTLSPKGKAVYEGAELTITTDYSRPSVRDRLIFGPNGSGALLPYGVYWRFGANEATEIEFNQDVLFGGNPLEAGRYRLYVYPYADSFEVFVNDKLGQWGYSKPGGEYDLFSFKVAHEKINPPKERFTIWFEEANQRVQLLAAFSDSKIGIPIKKQP